MSIFNQKVIKYEMKPLSSLEKVFPDETPVYRMECQMLSGLWGETVSFQVAYTGDFVMRERACRACSCEDGGDGSGRTCDKWNRR